jgi:hypothetical protein
LQKTVDHFYSYQKELEISDFGNLKFYL